MGRGANAVKVEYERFSCEVSYVCPKCGTKSYCDLEPSDVHWMHDSYIAGECAKCGETLKLTAS